MVLQLYSWTFSSCLHQINKSAVLFIPFALLKNIPSLVYYCLRFLCRIINCTGWKFMYQLLSLESCYKLLKIKGVRNSIYFVSWCYQENYLSRSIYFLLLLLFSYDSVFSLRFPVNLSKIIWLVTLSCSSLMFFTLTCSIKYLSYLLIWSNACLRPMIWMVCLV